MKKILLILLSLLAFSSCKDGGGDLGASDSITLAWDASPDVDIAGYRLYVGEKSGDYYKSFDVGNTLTYTVKSLASGNYYFACTAYNSLGNESVYSNEIHANLNSN